MWLIFSHSEFYFAAKINFYRKYYDSTAEKTSYTLLSCNDYCFVPVKLWGNRPDITQIITWNKMVFVIACLLLLKKYFLLLGI